MLFVGPTQVKRVAVCGGVSMIDGGKSYVVIAERRRIVKQGVASIALPKPYTTMWTKDVTKPLNFSLFTPSVSNLEGQSGRSGRASISYGAAGNVCHAIYSGTFEEAPAIS